MTQPTAETISILDPATYGNGDPTTFGLPLAQYRWMRDELPLVRQEFNSPMLVPATWIVTRYEDVAFVDRNPELFSAALGPTTVWAFTPVGDAVAAPSMLTRDGDEQSEHRRTVSHAFTPKMVRSFEEKFRTYAIDVVEKALVASEPFCFVKKIAHPLPMLALGDILGVPDEDRAKFFGFVDTFSAAFDPRVTRSPEEVWAAVQGLHEYSIQLRDFKRENPGEDVATMIALADQNDEFARGNITTLACGAAESTVNSLSHGLHELMRNPDQMAWLREHQDDIPLLAMHEMVRIASPFTHMLRNATEDVELHGQVIPKGEPVAMMFSSGNFDERVIPDPDTFDMSREKNDHMSFGRGPHACLGKHIALMEMKILFEELLKRTKDIRPAGDISYVHDNYARGVFTLPVELVPA
jgi:cholest-4-en-3-one 26-monooxygenase